MDDLIKRLENADEGSRELDAEIVAYLNNAIVKKYPPSDDFGPKSKWQFWSMDGKHFLGNESKFPVPAYTTSLDAAVSLIPDNATHVSMYTGKKHGNNANVHQVGISFSNDGATPALAICIAALRARAGGE